MYCPSVVTMLSKSMEALPQEADFKNRRELKTEQLFLDLPSNPYFTNRDSKPNQHLNFGSCYEEELVKNAKAEGVSVCKMSVVFIVILEV